METFIGSAALALLGGMAWLAYEHPQEFRKLAWAAGVLVALATMGAALWNIAVTETAVLAIRAAPHDHDAVAAAVGAAKIKPEIFYMMGIGLPIYVMFLLAFVTKLKRNGERGL
jgi:hypothetical protein